MRKIVIDHLTSASGWTVNSPSTITTQEYPEFVAGLNDTSLQIKFDFTDTIKTATKTFTSVDVSDQRTLVFSVWSREYGSRSYLGPDDFQYKIKLNATDEFYFPVYDVFTHVEIGLKNVDSIDRIQIIALHDVTDYLIISEMVTEQETIPLDLLEEIKLDIEYRIETKYSDGILVGTVATAISGDATITFDSSPDFVEEYSVVKVKDGSNEEVIQFGARNGNSFDLIDYLGMAGALQNSYTSANVYLQFPVYLNPNQIDIRLPGIALWGIIGSPVLNGGKLDTQRDTFTADDSQERADMQIYDYSLQVDCESHNPELIDKMGRIIREMVGGEKTWVNGRLHDLSFDGPPIEQRPEVGFDIIHKMQYNISTRVSENISDRQTIVYANAPSIEADPRE